MKILADGIEVTSRSYYFLLDWNEANEHSFIMSTFGKSRLKDLTISEYKELFIHAMNTDLNYLEIKQGNHSIKF